MSLFADPSAFALFLVLPALWLIGRHAAARRRESLRRFGDPALLARTSSLPPRAAAPLRTILRWTGLTLLVLALARPQLGRQAKDLARTGRDIIVALDLSRSMGAADVGGTRLRLAKRLAWQLASARPGDRIGLVVFGGAGFLQLPPTSDLAAFQLFLDAASPDDIGDPSTNIVAGLKVAERALRREGTAAGSRAVILLTDGERSEGAIDPILELYGRARLPVFAVGIGTTEGARVPNDSGDATGPWHVDDIGRPIISKLDEDVLKAIALASGGSYARYDDRAALETMTRALTNLEARTLATQPATEPTERYQWPLFLAIVLLLTDSLLGLPRAASAAPPSGLMRPGAARRAVPAFAAGAAVLLILLSCTSAQRDVARAQQLYDDGKYLEAYEAYQNVLRQQGGSDVRYNAGNSLYRLKQYSEASKMYRDALAGASDKLRDQTYFNMGNSFVRAAEDANALSGYLERATDAYEEALRLNPDDRDAKWNLEIALARGGDPGERGSRGMGGRADYGKGGHEEGYEGNRTSAVGAMAGGGQGGDEGESAEELDEQQARSLLETVERQQLSTHEGRRSNTGQGGGRDW